MDLSYRARKRLSTYDKYADDSWHSVVLHGDCLYVRPDSEQFYRYDIAVDHWETLRSPPPVEMDWPSFCLVSAGLYLYGLNCDSKQTARYDSSTDSWSMVASMPPSIAQIRCDAIVVATGYERYDVYVLCNTDTATQQLYRYSTHNDAWSFVASCSGLPK